LLEDSPRRGGFRDPFYIAIVQDLANSLFRRSSLTPATKRVSYGVLLDYRTKLISIYGELGLC
jgi:hypothetical protein